MMLVAVAITFVKLARSKIVSLVIGSRAGSTARAPYAFNQTILPFLPTNTTAPGKRLLSIASAITASIRANPADEIDADSGDATLTCANTDDASNTAITGTTPALIRLIRGFI